GAARGDAHRHGEVGARLALLTHRAAVRLARVVDAAAVVANLAAALARVVVAVRRHALARVRAVVRARLAGLAGDAEARRLTAVLALALAHGRGHAVLRLRAGRRAVHVAVRVFHGGVRAVRARVGDAVVAHGAALARLHHL